MKDFVCQIGKRDITFDIMKAIALFLMIAGHTVGPESPIHNYIYAFHMPLFFMISGYFAKKKECKENISSLYRRIINPYIFICVIVILLKALVHYHNNNSIFIDWETAVFGVGPGWFLLAMFWGRIIFNALIGFPPKKYLIISFSLSSFPTILQWTGLYVSIPFCFMQGLSCTFFIAIGYFVRQKDILPQLDRYWWIVIISWLFWLNTSIFGEIEMSVGFFRLWVVDYLGAIGGTYLGFRMAKLLARHWQRLALFLTEVSIYSLAIYSIHTIDFCVHFWHHLSPLVSQEYMVMTILLLRLVLFYPIIQITKRIPFLYHLFVGKPKMSELRQ